MDPTTTTTQSLTISTSASKIRLQPSRLAASINLVMICSNFVLLLLIFTERQGTVRIALSVALVTLGPGSALVQWLTIRDRTLQLTLIFALSLATNLLFAQIIVNTHNLSDRLTIVCMSLLTLARPLPGSRWTHEREALTHNVSHEDRLKIRRSLFGARSAQDNNSEKRS